MRLTADPSLSIRRPHPSFPTTLAKAHSPTADRRSQQTTAWPGTKQCARLGAVALLAAPCAQALRFGGLNEPSGTFGQINYLPPSKGRGLDARAARQVEQDIFANVTQKSACFSARLLPSEYVFSADKLETMQLIPMETLEFTIANASPTVVECVQSRGPIFDKWVKDKETRQRQAELDAASTPAILTLLGIIAAGVASYQLIRLLSNSADLVGRLAPRPPRTNSIPLVSRSGNSAPARSMA